MSKTASDFDVVIVGASFAGLIAARTAAMRGLRVCVLEAKTEAGARVATTGILVKEAAEEIDIPHALTRRVHGVRLYSPGLRSVDLFSPGYYFLTTDTPNLLRWLAEEAARAGALIYYSTRFAGAGRDSGVFRINGFDATARHIIGADGADSPVARSFGLGRNSRLLVGVEAEYEGLVGADPRFLHCFLDSKLAPGYLAWVAPGPRVTQVGLAMSEGRRVTLNKFLARTERIFHFGEAEIVERRAGTIPCGGLVQPWAMPGVTLIGDAAGQVSPATGGGIRLAFRFGRRAAQAVADHLLHLGPPPEVALAAEMPRFGFKLALRRALDLAPSNMLLDIALATQPMRLIARQVYFHRRGGRGMSLAEYEARIGAIADPALYPHASTTT